MRIHDMLYGDYTHTNKNTLNSRQKIQLNMMEHQLSPLFNLLSEQDLTNDEIDEIFVNAINKIEDYHDIGTELSVTLPTNVKAQLEAKINELSQTIKTDAPITDFIVQLDNLKRIIIEHDEDDQITELFKYLKRVATDKPTSTLFIIGVITSARSMLKSSSGRDVAIFIRKTIDNLIPLGDEDSDDVPHSDKATIFNHLTGKIFQWLNVDILENIAFAKYDEINSMTSSMITPLPTNIAVEAINRNPALAEILDASTLTKVKLSGRINEFEYSYDVVLSAANTTKFNTIRQSFGPTEKFTTEYYKLIGDLHNLLAGVQRSPTQSTYRAANNVLMELSAVRKTLSQENLDAIVSSSEPIDVILNTLSTATTVIGNIVQSSIEQSKELKSSMFVIRSAEKYDEPKPGEEESILSSLYVSGTALTESIFSPEVDNLISGDNEPSDIITLDKLKTMWETAGKPSDSKEIKKILTKYFTSEVADTIVMEYDPDLVANEEEHRTQQLDSIAKEINDNVHKERLIAYLKSKITD